MSDMKDTVSDGYEVSRRGNVLDVALWYPRVSEQQPNRVTTIDIDLVDVRAADGLRVSYDFERDGWVVMQASKWEWEADEETDSDWQEVAFVKAWARDPERQQR